VPLWKKNDPAGSNLIGLLREIQNGATDASIGLPDTLRRARILASRLDHEQFKEWVIHELDGYPNASVLPPIESLRLSRSERSLACSEVKLLTPLFHR
jgi:hypothetical protein